MAYKQLKLWFDKDLAIMLGNKIIRIDEKFNKNNFVKVVDQGVTELELKDRVQFISNCLFEYLGADYSTGINTLLQILGPENPKEIDMFKEYYWIMPIAKYVEDYGLEDYSLSMKALEAITQRNTSEYAIRPFIKKYPQKTIKQMLAWSKSSSFHVRRLSSEGGRPRLPWASKLQMFIDDPAPLLPILENLKDDTSKYVQNSVANCINDFVKDNRPVAEALIESWIKEASIERKWIIKHAIRNLRKVDDPWALTILDRLN